VERRRWPRAVVVTSALMAVAADTSGLEIIAHHASRWADAFGPRLPRRRFPEGRRCAAWRRQPTSPEREPAALRAATHCGVQGAQLPTRRGVFLLDSRWCFVHHNAVPYHSPRTTPARYPAAQASRGFFLPARTEGLRIAGKGASFETPEGSRATGQDPGVEGREPALSEGDPSEGGPSGSTAPSGRPDALATRQRDRRRRRTRAQKRSAEPLRGSVALLQESPTIAWRSIFPDAFRYGRTRARATRCRAVQALSG
jgi:hypothetical protein